MFITTAVRILVIAINLAVVTTDGILFAGLARTVFDSLESYTAGLVSAALALWVTFNRTATMGQRVAHEAFLNVALIYAAFRPVSGPIAELAKDAKVAERCGLSLFLYFVKSGPLDLWLEFLVVWIVGRWLVWAIEEMGQGVR
jgi:hypothetical protein